MYQHFDLNHKAMAEHEAHRMDLMRQAEAQRLAREAQPANQGAGAVYAPLMESIGRAMIAWGTALQERYSRLADQPEAIQLALHKR